MVDVKSVKSKLDMAMNLLPTSQGTVAGYRMVQRAVKTKGFPVLVGGVLLGYFARNLIDDAVHYVGERLGEYTDGGEET